MQIYIERNRTHVKMKFSGPVSKLLSKLKVNPEAVLVVRNSELLTPNDTVSNNDEIKVLSVISGG